ncbi:MAG: zf-TFIIB domain-containing protein [Vicinamibacteria bacterium]|nr:zf-TFIIB domain-containing protein [Vicinamibacteria bacterium]
MTNTAGTLCCPKCGAPAAPDERACRYCGVSLAVVACPFCLGMQFVGSEHCSRCGAELKRASRENEVVFSCPRCRDDLRPIVVGTTGIDECPRCGGTWIEARAFERLLNEREDHSAILGAVSTRSSDSKVNAAAIRYIPCPQCGRLMNRMNFAHCSGVIVDLCKGHGVWFDADELRRIVAFVREGGMARARAREREDLKDEMIRLRQQQYAASRPLFSMEASGSRSRSIADWGDLVCAAGELLESLLGD